ncbi:hypothetical protein [uncultured Tateyamaria sp.]|uniref:hypothetical protein n=1 Tax=uncultured Tateyamaria sp. TaxID=455651 RepID=UPI00262ED035|nr:hypothetical protein [uncultured Tateyamaria sp.]
MNFDRNAVALGGQDVHDMLFGSLTMGLPTVFSIEWLLDRAEDGAWGGFWW